MCYIIKTCKNFINNNIIIKKYEKYNVSTSKAELYLVKKKARIIFNEII